MKHYRITFETYCSYCEMIIPNSNGCNYWLCPTNK